ncbi:DMT family transporter [Streptomyces lonarensis]|uniref:DMT family transporter n=1 Tax=Streptomyces lonarensis TaxID=700599 RepID=UPI0028AA2D0B|nr:DMT family transporter [Streptomyces lonarensis]
MRTADSPGPGTAAGLRWGLLGVAAFSLTVPLTRIAVAGLPPLFVGAGRAVVAALLAALALAVTCSPLPRGGQWARLAVVAAGIVLGFPLLTSAALTTAPAGHSAVVIALLPAATAAVAALRGGERPPRRFWAAVAAGAVVTVAFAAVAGGGAGGRGVADLLLLAAVVAGAVGYAEGGLLARELGAWRTVSWALVLAAPVTLPLTVAAAVPHLPSATAEQWAAFAYLGVVSMFLGFFAWYRGLALGPMTRVSQVQLVQPVLTVAWAALLLREPFTATVVVGAVAVVLCAGAAVRSRRPAAGPVVVAAAGQSPPGGA